MRHKLYERFKTLMYNLSCKICECPIIPGDEVESKAGGNGPKLYHAQCYDDAHQHFEYNEEKLSRYPREDLIEIVEDEFEVELENPDELTDEDLIDFILLLELEWIQNQKS